MAMGQGMLSQFLAVRAVIKTFFIKGNRLGDEVRVMCVRCEGEGGRRWWCE